jgi:ABC-type multidrug transport system fused ATPase/permease subunit
MKETITNLKKVYQYGKEYKMCLVIQIICCIFGIGFNVVMPLLSAKLIVNFTDSMFEQAILMSIVILILCILDEIKTLIIRKNTQIFRRGTVRNMQMSLGRETLKLEQATIDSNSSGMFIQRLTNDTDKMAGMFTTGMGKVTGFISNIGSFIAILLIDYHMFIYYLVAAIILTILYYIKNESVGEKDKEFRHQCDKVSGLTGELIRGARDIKMLFAKESFMKELDSNIKKQSELNFEMRNTDMGYSLVIDIIKDIFEFMTIIILIILIKNDILTVAVAFALFSYKSTVLTNLMSSVSSLLEECKNFNISSNRVFEIINNKKFQKEKFGKKHLDNVEGNFQFNDVCFSYDGKKNVLDNLNLSIKANKTYGIVGKSGEGKTTMFNLLCKLYDYQSGLISIDGVNINELDEESIRGNITIINQNPYIFNLSIKDNLKLVKSDVTDKEIKEACNLACLTEFIESLPKKYETVVGEGGVTLSGGQRQRLAIARALIQKTKIILFDEATSALDNETQNNIQSAINNLKDDYTIVIIAHRLSTIMNCEKIFFMKNGKIENEGSHSELLKKCKEYKELYEYEIKSNN